MTNSPIPEHFFVSYSHADQITADKIVADLEEASIPIWIDRTGLAPGTPNWNNAIRNAVHRSFAVLLLASSNSGRSDIIQGELNLAERYGRPIYPVWIADQWEDCVPIGMIQAQYIDCRPPNYSRGLTQLIGTLKSIMNFQAPRLLPLHRENTPILPRGYLSLRLKHAEIAIRPGSYQSLADLLNDVYINYLTNQYKPFTYGSDWILASEGPGTKQLIVPWSWLVEKGNHQPLHRSNSLWFFSPPETYGLVATTKWEIIDRFPIPSFGVASHDSILSQVLQSQDLLAEKLMLQLEHLLLPPLNRYNEEGVECVAPETINPNDYQVLLVFAPRIPGIEGKALILSAEWINQIPPSMRPDKIR
jgi:hypothetical protein